MISKKITFTLSPKTFELLNYYSEKTGMKKSAIIALALSDFDEKKRRFSEISTFTENPTQNGERSNYGK